MSQQNYLKFKTFNKIRSVFFPRDGFPNITFSSFMKKPLKQTETLMLMGKEESPAVEISFLSVMVRMKNPHPPWIQP